VAFLLALFASLTIGTGPAHARTAPVNPSSVSTATPQWACVLQHESGDGKFSPNLFQFQNTALERTIGMTRSPGSYTRQEQDAFALKTFAYAQRVWGNGFEPWRADSRLCGLGVTGDSAR